MATFLCVLTEPKIPHHRHTRVPKAVRCVVLMAADCKVAPGSVGLVPQFTNASLGRCPFHAPIFELVAQSSKPGSARPKGVDSNCQQGPDKQRRPRIEEARQTAVWEGLVDERQLPKGRDPGVPGAHRGWTPEVWQLGNPCPLYPCHASWGASPHKKTSTEQAAGHTEAQQPGNPGG